MRCSGFVMTNESGEVLAVSVGGASALAKSLAPESAGELVTEHKRLVSVLRSPSHADDLVEADKQAKELRHYEAERSSEDMAKSHVKSYTRKDGTFVKEHDDNRTAAQPEVKTGDAAREGHGSLDDQRKKFYGVVTRSYMHPSGHGVVESHDGSGYYAHHTTSNGGKSWATHGIAGPKTREREFNRHLGEAQAKGGKSAAAQPDEHNPKFALQPFPSKSLHAAASGKDDLNHRAKVQLASRGLDSDGKWVGFDAAAKHHGVSSKEIATDPDADATHGHMQTLHTKVLSDAAKGKVDLNHHARKELEARGEKPDGKGGEPLRKALFFPTDPKAFRRLAE